VFANLDQLPTDKSMFTLAVTDQPAGTPAADLFYDEVDVVADRRSTVAEVIAAADLAGYEESRVIGVTNQTDGYVVAETPDGDLR
jgi:hypothetical protein